MPGRSQATQGGLGYQRVPGDVGVLHTMGVPGTTGVPRAVGMPYTIEVLGDTRVPGAMGIPRAVGMPCTVGVQGDGGAPSTISIPGAMGVLGDTEGSESHGRSTALWHRVHPQPMAPRTPRSPGVGTQAVTGTPRASTSLSLSPLPLSLPSPLPCDSLWAVQKPHALIYLFPGPAGGGRGERGALRGARA